MQISEIIFQSIYDFFLIPDVCHDDSDCHNGGKCEISENGSLKNCHCLQGTDGPFCKKVTDCNMMDCGKDATCTYDIDTTATYCKCNISEQKFDEEDKKCKRRCSCPFTIFLKNYPRIYFI